MWYNAIIALSARNYFPRFTVLLQRPVCSVTYSFRCMSVSASERRWEWRVYLLRVTVMGAPSALDFID